MNVITVPASDTAAIISALREDGAVIVERVLDDDLLTRFNEELDPFVAAASPDHDGAFLNPMIAAFFGTQVRHVTGIAAKSRLFATEVMTHPVYMAVADAVLLPSCACYQLNLAHVMDRGPGSERQYLHRDEDVWVHMPRPHEELQLASVIALVDFTEERGATVVAPGSHRWPRDRVPAEHELAVAEMQAGSAVLYLGSTIHAGGANTTTSDWRRGMHLSYCLGWLRTEENQYLTTPPEVAATLPPESTALLGYAAHDAIMSGGGYLGTVDLVDPQKLLASGALGRL